VANVTSTQTTNLPTAALTRYTSGAGVFAAIEISSSGIGSTQTTGTISYTNQAGTAGQTGRFGTIGSTTHRFYFCTLDSGDTGVRSVESVTLVTSTGTAGNFGVTLYRPLAFFVPGFDMSEAIDPWMSGGMIGDLTAALVDDACLFMVGMPSKAGSMTVSGSISMAEY
jgi:hypothetical protein